MEHRTELLPRQFITTYPQQWAKVVAMAIADAVAMIKGHEEDTEEDKALWKQYGCDFSHCRIPTEEDIELVRAVLIDDCTSHGKLNIPGSLCLEVEIKLLPIASKEQIAAGLPEKPYNHAIYGADAKDVNAPVCCWAS